MMQRTVVAPTVDSDFAQAGESLSYWKQILPQRKIHYTTKSGKRAVLDFDEAYLTDLAKAHAEHVLDQTPFLLADSDNKHTMDPERIRADVAEMRLAKEGEAPGLYGRFVFPNAAAAKAVIDNPKLGVSARIREGISRSDGTSVPRAMIHVLGTLDPQVTGMAPWVPAVDLSFDPNDNVLDLSNESYEQESAVQTDQDTPQVYDPATITDEQIDAMSEAEIDAFLAEYAPGILDESPDPIEDEAEVDEIDEIDEIDHDTELEPALSAKATKDIELANSAAAAAQTRANEAMKRMAAAEWREFRTSAVNDGVPPHLLDLAEPVLNRPDDMVIDLSNSDDDDVNVSEVVRQFIEAAKGTVDLSHEAGHSGTIGAEDDPDTENLALLKNQF